ncbi:hypothetical protein CKAH01_18281 [Colletotrichum kahawae]|uniref:Uncharacterized protein n=1 Tax=Colletotrichum kahawae TaxID=34407 RepID=A0AAD9Y8P7_COLKA|nr:hypothetical protein CKAH01_18281 [Colletotrichum kahawae]
MASGTPGHIQPGMMHGSQKKRDRNLYVDSDDDENLISAKRPRSLIVSSGSKHARIRYGLDEIKGALRGELLSTPTMQPLVQEFIGEMLEITQTERRVLCENTLYARTKAAMKNQQADKLIDLKRYLLAETFIRIDNWNFGPLREWFDLVFTLGLEREFRDKYWEDNQRAYSFQIAKLASHVGHPKISRTKENHMRLSAEYGNNAKDIVSRSVFVKGRGHPVIRSAVAIMVLAGQENPENKAKRQENAARTSQIWAAWCIAKHGEDETERQFLAALIYDRYRENDCIRTCFYHVREELEKLGSKVDKDEFKKWQRMHWRCHLITISEYRSRPVAFKIDEEPSKDTRKASASHDDENSLSAAIGSIKLKGTTKKAATTIPVDSKQATTKSTQAQESPVETDKKPVIRRKLKVISKFQPDETSQSHSQAPVASMAPQVQLPPQLLRQSSSTTASPAPLPLPGPSKGLTHAQINGMLGVLMQWFNPSESNEEVSEKQYATDHQVVSTKLDENVLERISALENRLNAFSEFSENIIDAVQTLGDRHAHLDDTQKSMDKRQNGMQESMDNEFRSVAEKQTALAQRQSSMDGELGVLSRKQNVTHDEVGTIADRLASLESITKQRLSEQDRTLKQRILEQERTIRQLQRDVEFLREKQSTNSRKRPFDSPRNESTCAPKGPSAMMRTGPGYHEKAPSRFDRR